MAASGQQRSGRPGGEAGTVQFNIRLSPSLRARFRRACALAGRQQQEVIAKLITDWLAQQGQ
jgi:hypothetical protein